MLNFILTRRTQNSPSEYRVRERVGRERERESDIEREGERERLAVSTVPSVI